MAGPSEKPEIRVLFEYKDSRQELFLSPIGVCEAISLVMTKFATGSSSAEPVVKLASTSTVTTSASPQQYLLQRWAQEWQTFVDVQAEDEIRDRDRLTVVPKPAFSPEVNNYPILNHSLA